MPVMQRTTNRLLAALPAHERDRCLAACMQVELVYGGSLQEDGERIRHAYFPTGGFISLLATVDARATLEVGMIGDEGMYGHELALGGDVASLRALTQGAGSAWRMPASKFLSAHACERRCAIVSFLLGSCTHYMRECTPLESGFVAPNVRFFLTY